MFGALEWIEISVGAVLGAMVAGVIAYGIGHAKGDTQGYNRRIAEQAVADQRVEAERKGDDAKIGSMADYDLCVASLRRRGMPVEPCDELRGLQPQ
jgi:hypothetical protein